MSKLLSGTSLLTGVKPQQDVKRNNQRHSVTPVTNWNQNKPRSFKYLLPSGGLLKVMQWWKYSHSLGSCKSILLFSLQLACYCNPTKAWNSSQSGMEGAYLLALSTDTHLWREHFLLTKALILQEISTHIWSTHRAKQPFNPLRSNLQNQIIPFLCETGGRSCKSILRFLQGHGKCKLECATQYFKYYIFLINSSISKWNGCI